MNTKEFFERMNNIVKPGRRDIIEKDFYLHRFLNKMSKDEYLNKNFVFKGGSCLIKAYVGYYRFSEDIDLTWKSQERWADMSSSQTRKRCSEEIDTIIEKFESIARELGLDFKAEKGDSRYVDIGGRGRMPSFFVRYDSEMIDMPSMIKIEINFVDRTIYPYQKKELGSFAEDVESEELSFLFEECWDEYTDPVEIECYDPRDIYTDKCRALLTRRVYKMRDSIDLYVLGNKYGYGVGDYKNKIIEKTEFMLDLYEKYRKNWDNDLPSSEQLADEETRLLIQPLSNDLEKGISRIHKEIEDIRKDLVKRTKGKY